MVERYTRVFSEYLKAFTRQDVKIMLGFQPVFLENVDGSIEINDGHLLFKVPEIGRLYRIIIQSFLELMEKEKHPSITAVGVKELTDKVDLVFENTCFNNWFPYITTTLICALANEKYEGQDSTGLLAVFCPRKIDYAAELTAFVPVCVGDRKKLSFSDIHAHRKFLGLTKGQCLVYELTGVRDGNPVYELVGLADRETAAAKLFGIHFLPHSVWAVTQPHWMSRGGGNSLNYVAVFRDAHFCLPDFPLGELEKSWIMHKLSALEKFGVLAFGSDPICTILAQAKKQEKGTLIVLTDTEHAEALAKQLCQSEMAIEVGTAKNRPRLIDKPEYLARFSSIDGAILADFNGKCYAIGAILSGGLAKGNIGRGSRYNCTVSFLENHSEPCIAIVVSEDHIVNLLDNLSPSLPNLVKKVEDETDSFLLREDEEAMI